MIYLEKGKFYDIVATIKEAQSLDYLTVAVELPDGKFVAPIPAERLFFSKFYLLRIFQKHTM